MKLLIALVAVAMGCQDDKPAAPPRRPPPDPTAESYTSLRDYAKSGDLSLMVMYYAGLPTADRAKTAAPQVARFLLASWDKVREEGTRMATNAGLDRARDKNNGLGLPDALAMLDELSAQAPDLAAKWTPLKAELVALEQATYTEEHDDKRPRVTVWTPVSEHATPNEMLGADISDCVLDAVQKKWPAFKFVPEYHQVDGPSIEIVVLSQHDEYRSTTGETMRMAAGGALALRSHELSGPLAKALTEDVVARASVTNPTQIRSDLGVTPALEASNAGLSAIRSTREQLCTGVEKALAAR